jgi:hypothetical protein
MLNLALYTKAYDLGLDSDVELIPKNHQAAQNRYIYYNNKITPISKLSFDHS